ncbi:MAG TPA: DUF5103 domain-containing protein [Bacteroidales bacterium]|nr:DUF5103 domain-containing protein [Bacteroidales bacterium]
MRNFFLFFILIFTIQSAAQDNFEDKTYKENIRTVLMFVEGDELSFPVLDLQSDKKMVLLFDDLDADIKDYYYTIIHCNADWNPSDLDPSEYIDGYFEDQIDQYQSSFNTTVDYTHYTLTLPNDYLKPVLSGNYIIKVYDSANPEEIVFTKRFMLVESQTQIETQIKNMAQSSYFYNDQQLEIKVEYIGSDFYDIDQNIQLSILKNFNWEQSLVLDRADVIRNNEFIYHDFSRLKFKGGNEFHHFNTKNIHYAGENIKNISFANQRYHFQLTEDKDKTFDDYEYKQDINGQFKIDVTQSNYPPTEADYAYVYFALRMDAPVQKGDIYVWGALSNYNFTHENKMQYNFEHKAYECRLFLKQGYYNYRYVLVEDNNPDFTYIDGNHVQTENSYTVLVYYHDFRGNYDRLIGVQHVKTVN